MAVGHRRRVMKKVFENGIETLLEHEFLELCLFSVYKRCDTNPLAHALLDKFGNLEAVCNATEKELMSVDGIGRAAAEYIRLIPYITKGYSIHTSMRKKQRFDTKESIYNRCVALLDGQKNEVAYVLCFDNMHHLIKEVKIAEGSPGMVDFDARKVMNAVANTSTTSIVICHNHPSGLFLPSQQDYLTTKNIKQVMESVGIELLDHVVVADGNYISCVSMNGPYGQKGYGLNYER